MKFSLADQQHPSLPNHIPTRNNPSERIASGWPTSWTVPGTRSRLAISIFASTVSNVQEVEGEPDNVLNKRPILKANELSSNRNNRAVEVTKRRRWLASAVAVGVAVISIAIGISVCYARDIRTIRDRVSRSSQLIQSRHGPIEFTTWGSGRAVLVAHGAGGGYDQGSLIAKAYGGDGFRWIVPSRFGYLRSPLPADASTAAQADAFADLLDALSIQRVAILAISGGVPPSLQFAQRYPARTSALVLLSSAPYTPLKAGAQKLPVPPWVYEALFRSDFPYWVLQRVGREGLESIFDVTPTARAAMTPEEKVFVDGMVERFQPVSQRVDGIRNEGAAIAPGAYDAVGEIAVPTLVVHARDDGINPFLFGEYTARHIRGAEFMPLSSGGHLLLGHQAEVRARVNSFLRR